MVCVHRRARSSGGRHGPYRKGPVPVLIIDVRLCEGLEPLCRGTVSLRSMLWSMPRQSRGHNWREDLTRKSGSEEGT